MRPRLLEIEGLQSFTETQIIDFDILGETGLFGIFGPTGSGKSTILDAITFALYGRVKRAENGTQGIINSGYKTVRVAFTFDLSKNGKRSTYRVERTYQRRKKSPNACEAKIARLIEVNEGGDIPLCDKATEVSNFIKELLGLGNEDFTRAVVLPQNSFHEFLMLKNSDRRGMLERIFYLEEYGRLLTDKIARKMSALRSRIDLLTGELMGYADASDEALKEAKSAMEAAEEDRKRTESELKRLEAAYNESKEVWSLVCELNDLARREDSHRISEPAISKKRIQLEKAVKADGLAAMIRKNREQEEKLKVTEKLLAEIAAVLPGVKDKLAQTKAEYNRIKCEAAAGRQKLVEQRTRLQDALGVKAEAAMLNSRIDKLQGLAEAAQKTAESTSADIARENAELEGLKRKLQSLISESEPLRTEPEYRQQIQQGAALENEAASLAKTIEQLQGKKAAAKKTTGELEEQLDSLMKKIAAGLTAEEELTDSIKKHEAGKPGDRDSVIKMMEKVHKAQGIYQVLKLRKDDVKLSKTKSKELGAAFEDAKHRAAELDKVRADVTSRCEQCRLQLDECLRELDKNTAYSLSKRLKEGEPCPVCGSLEHPLPAAHRGAEEAAILEQKVENARKKLADAEALLKEAEKDAVIAAENYKTISKQLDQAIKDQVQKDKDFEEERQKLPDEWKSLELLQIRQKIEKADSNAQTRQQLIEAWEVKLAEFKEQIDKHHGLMADLRITQNSISAELKVNNDNLARLETELAEASERLCTVRRKLEKYLVRYSITSAAAELAKLSENDHRLNEIESVISRTRKAADDMRVRIDQLNGELSRLNNERTRLETDLSSLTAQGQEKERKLSELAGGVDIEDGIAQIDKKLRSYDEADTEYTIRIDELEKHHNELVVNKSSLDSKLSFYSENLSVDREKLFTALEENGFSGPDEAESCIMKQDEQKVLKAETDKYDQESINIKAHRGLLEKKLKTRSITEEEWNRIEHSYKELLEHSKKTISDSEVAKNHYNNISRKHNRWEELRSTLAGVSHKHGLYEQIQKLLKAVHGKDNSFIDYIAEERLRYVAAKASSTLGVMTGHRYALELDAESGFIIRDDANGGIHRMVTTLSGGETFLTSLSLALALSEQIQLKGQSPLEFFFLDEGFGTLDHGLLDSVMDSLEKLSSSDRVIGIISHVPELKQRIARRLSVTPATFDGKGSKVAIEKS